METWTTPTAANGPQYNPLPTNSDLEGSRAAVLESRLFSCGGSDAMKDCFSTVEGQPDWKPAPSLQASITHKNFVFQVHSPVHYLKVKFY